MCQSVVTLAESAGFGSGRQCSCGCIQLNLGPVMIRLQPEALVQAIALLQAAEQKRLLRKQDTLSDWPSTNGLLH